VAAGDTISGNLRFARQKANGSVEVVAGPFSSWEMDHKGDPSNSPWFNVPRDYAPQGANLKYAKDAVWKSGEIILVQHKSASLAEAADYDADEVFIGVLQEDLNRDERIPRTLTVADTELTSDPTTSTSDWVTVFKYTVPDRTKIALFGMSNVAVVEAA